MRYLGVYLAKNVNKSVDTTINKTMEKNLKKKQRAQAKKAQFDQKRKPYEGGDHYNDKPCLSNNKKIDKLEKERNKAFWSKEENAIHRITGPIQNGGLNLTSLGCPYRSSYIALHRE